MRVSFFRLYIFLLLLGNWTITLGADDITAVKAPNSVVAGTVVSVEVRYASSSDRDILVNFQLNSDPWTNFGNKRITVSAGSSTLLIPVAIGWILRRDSTFAIIGWIRHWYAWMALHHL